MFGDLEFGPFNGSQFHQESHSIQLHSFISIEFRPIWWASRFLDQNLSSFFRVHEVGYN
jgi:hypothetical protein